MAVASYLGYFKARPLKYIVEGKIQSAPKEILKAAITHEFLEKVTKKFRRTDPVVLRDYYLVLKADYESWNSFDHPLISAFVPVITFLIGVMISQLPVVERWAVAGLAAIMVIVQVALQVRPAARKRAKAILFINIIEEIMRRRQGTEAIDMQYSTHASRICGKRCVKVRVTDRGETVVSTISSSDCSPRVEIEYDFEKSL